MTRTPYPEIEANPDFPALEQEILRFWEQSDGFRRSVQSRPAARAGKNNAYVFYDGPPFANGLPHYGHLLTGYVKDAIARYHTMKGNRVERRFGWDCHGLPAEMGAEKELGISGRAAIMNYGIGKFNEHCRESVMKYRADWRYYVTRQGRWVDFDHDYKTMDTDFMESVLWAFKSLYDKGLIYESMRVMPYSWAAETPLSNFETRLDNATREREDKAAYVKFTLFTQEQAEKEIGYNGPVYIMAWTTTPWTLPSNLALAISKNVQYVEVDTDKGLFIVAQSFAEKFFKDNKDYDVRDITPIALNAEGAESGISIEELLNSTYQPLFPYFKDIKNAFRILDGSDFVTDGDGTGIVHMAPGFGEVDQKCCEANGIEVIVPVDGQGKYTDAIFDLPDLKLKGMNVVADQRIEESDTAQHIAEKDTQKFGLVNMRIVRWLKKHDMLVKDENFKHNYPHCWRTDTPLIYRAMPSWYVEVTKFRDRAAEINQQINWIPSHIRDGQMDHMLKTAPDWSISRNRFWGTPIPVWRSNNPNSKEPIKVFGSIAELEAFFGPHMSSSCGPRSGSAGPRALDSAPPDGSQNDGFKIHDLHRPYIDALIAPDGEGYQYTRVEDVFDCWFESGSMPFAQLHYPFENKELFEKNFPADFITEYVGQTRGWFNTLIMLSTALFDKPPFKNCICHGVVLDAETGQKYSKRLKNYKDPKEVMDNFGADALRWMMLASPVMRGADIGVDPEGKFIRDVVRLNIKPLWSAFNFFTLYANADGVKANLLSSCGPQGGSAGTGAMDSAQPDGSHNDSKNMLDLYILAKAKAAVVQIERSLDAYDTTGATEASTVFFDVLNNWYIRRSRSRFWAEEVTADKQAAYDTLYTVLNLLCLATAPLLPFVTEAVYRGLNGVEKSVHLEDFPDVSWIDDAGQLVTDMDRVQDICNAALAIRNKKNIRVRQPLASIRIATDSDVAHQWKERYGSLIADIIKDEVNVKSVEEGNMNVEAVATKKLAVNSAVLGKRLPAKMKQILPASKKGEWRVTPEGLVVADELLLPGEYTLTLEPKGDYAECSQPLSTNDALVILDLTITPELEAEGRARDLVRMIQQARKDAGLNVADRITLGLDVPEAFKEALLTHGDFIASQTLAISWAEGSGNSAQKMKQELDGAEFVIGISKAAA